MTIMLLHLDPLISSNSFIFYDDRYAREDTHYLLHIYDLMRTQLLSMAELENSNALLLEV